MSAAIGNIQQRPPIRTSALGISVNDHQSERAHWEHPSMTTNQNERIELPHWEYLSTTTNRMIAHLRVCAAMAAVDALVGVKSGGGGGGDHNGRHKLASDGLQRGRAVAGQLQETAPQRGRLALQPRPRPPARV
eukprot:3349645-Pyramimonas_sp.AAC.1